MEWKPLSLDDKAIVDEQFKRYPLLLSDYTFTNLWMWNEKRRYEIAFINGHFCIKFNDHGKEKHLYPRGQAPYLPTIALLVEHSENLHMRAIPEEGTKELEKRPWKITPEEAHFDYIYDFDELVQLPGNKYQPKRNLIHQFDSLYPYQYHEITNDLLPQIISLEEQWFDTQSSPLESMVVEHAGALRLLNDFDKLNLQGGVLFVEETPVAYTITECATEEMVVVHVEKALSSYKGAYAAINQQHLMHIPKLRYVNREEDLGLPNLEKVKKSYHPILIEKKFELLTTH